MNYCTLHQPFYKECFQNLPLFFSFFNLWLLRAWTRRSSRTHYSNLMVPASQQVKSAQRLIDSRRQKRQPSDSAKLTLGWIMPCEALKEEWLQVLLYTVCWTCWDHQKNFRSAMRACWLLSGLPPCINAMHQCNAMLCGRSHASQSKDGNKDIAVALLGESWQKQSW